VRVRTHGIVFDTVTRRLFVLLDFATLDVSEVFAAAAAVNMPYQLLYLQSLAILSSRLLPKLLFGEIQLRGMKSMSGSQV